MSIPIDKTEYLLRSFNEFNRNIKFTMELEINNRLPFLDLLVIRNSDGSLSTDWYHKKTWSARYLNFNSHLPFSYKLNTVKLLSQKILQLSDSIFHFDNFRLLKNTLVENGYPNSLINRIINSTKHPNSNPNVEIRPVSDNSETKWVTIPYVKSLFENIDHCLKKFKFKAVGKAHYNLGKSLFSPLKDPTPLNDKRNVVYKVTCECEKTYVGQTTQLLSTRFNQHKRDAQKLTLKRVNTDSTSALSTHIYETKHKLFLDNVRVLETEANSSTRRVLEMIHISKAPNNINKQSDCIYLQNTYSHLF